MALIAAFQPALDELDASITEIKALVTAGGGASAQDVADTVAAVQQRADDVKAALTPPAAG